MSVLANILFVSCLLFAGDNYQTHAQTKPPAGSKRTPPSQSGCNYNSETLRGVVKDFNPAYGGSVFPTLSYVFNVVCGNYADDWNVAVQWSVRETDLFNYSPRFFTLLHLAQWQALQLNSVAARPVDDNLLVAFVSHYIMVSTFPQYFYRYDGLLAMQVAGFGDRETLFARAAAIPVAVTLLESRLYDGTQQMSSYEPAPPGGPIGVFQNIPNNYPGAHLEEFARARGFVVTQNHSEIPAVRNLPTPPPFQTPDYYAQINAVKLLGGLNSTVRDEYQTETAFFWAEQNGTCGCYGHWNQIALSTMPANYTLHQEVTLLAQLNVALYDAFVVTFRVKYKWKRWRPITAIRQGDCKPGQAPPMCITPDPTWTSLLPTPNFPNFPNWVAGCSGVGDYVLTMLNGGNFSFSIGSETYGPYRRLTPRRFKSYTHASLDSVDSRVYQGIATPSGAVEGRNLSIGVTEYVMAHFDRLDPTSPNALVEFENMADNFERAIACAAIEPSDTVWPDVTCTC